MQLNKRLDNFELKLRQLASKFERQEKERSILQQENKELKKELDRQRGVISGLREKLDTAQHGNTQAGGNPGEMPTEVRKQINACIRELDQCIEWLENH